MKFLIDQDAYKVTIDFMRGLGHEVITALFLSHRENHDVIRLKIEPKNISEVHEELTNFLRRHGTLDLSDYFVVIEPGRHRIRFCKRET